MAMALKAYLLLSGMERGPVPQAAELLAKLRSLKLNDRERRHAAAIACLIDGAFNRASERLDDILIDDGLVHLEVEPESQQDRPEQDDRPHRPHPEDPQHPEDALHCQGVVLTGDPMIDDEPPF